MPVQVQICIMRAARVPVSPFHPRLVEHARSIGAGFDASIHTSPVLSACHPPKTSIVIRIVQSASAAVVGLGRRYTTGCRGAGYRVPGAATVERSAIDASRN